MFRAEDKVFALHGKTPYRLKVAMPKSLAYEPSNALNAICPYFTMFPLEYPLRVLRNHRKERPIVMDPFCGRGTTLFAARKLGFDAWGVDASPVAVAVARAKLASCDVQAPLELARRLLATTTASSQVPETDFFRSAFHPKVLTQLCVLRQGLLSISRETSASAMLRAAVLGCLHGPLSKTTENAGYFSNQCPRTFAPKPDYAVRFWKERNLNAPLVDVIAVLERKLSRLRGHIEGGQSHFSRVHLGDSQKLKSFPAASRDFGVVVTSPPYYGMKTYVQDQWLRNWFLGGADTVDYAAGAQLLHGGQSVFAESLGKVWANMATSRADDLHMYVRFGIIPSAAVDARELMLMSLEASGAPWRVVSTRKANAADAGKRQAKQMQAASNAALEFDFHLQRK